MNCMTSVLHFAKIYYFSAFFYELSQHFCAQKAQIKALLYILSASEKSYFAILLPPATHLLPPNFAHKQGLSGVLVAEWQQILKNFK